MVGAWYCFGDFDFILIADVPLPVHLLTKILPVMFG